MNWDVIGKYIAAGGILGSIYALVILKLVDPNVYIAAASGVLTGLGVYHVATNIGSNGDQNAPPAPAQPPAPHP